MSQEVSDKDVVVLEFVKGDQRLVGRPTALLVRHLLAEQDENAAVNVLQSLYGYSMRIRQRVDVKSTESFTNVVKAKNVTS